MPTYTPPAGNAVDFELVAYTPPVGSAVDFDLSEEEIPPDPGGGGSVASISGSSVNVRLEIIYASVASHTAPSVARDTHFLMSRIGGELGINITSGMRSFETNLRILYRAISGNNYTGDIHSTELILRAIESEL